MSKDAITDYNVDPDLNTDFGGTGALGSNYVSNFDNTQRIIASHLAKMNAGTSPLHDTFCVADPADLTKKVRIDAGNVTTGTTRVLTMPDADVTLPAAPLVTTTDTQTLTNKTLTAPVISTISNTGTVTLPTATDTLVGRATTDTLSNKTFSDTLRVTLSDDGATVGPAVTLLRESTSPAANDALAIISVFGRNSAAAQYTYAQIYWILSDPTAGSEDSLMRITTSVAGTIGIRAYVGAGLVVGTPTGGDKGAGTINATAVYDDNVLLT